MLETKTAYTFVKQGIFYFSRRVPKDLSHHYDSSRIVYSLRTRSAVVASSRSLRAAQQLDEHWHYLRIQDCDLPGKHLLRVRGGPSVTRDFTSTSTLGSSTKLSEAVSIYIELKGKRRPITFNRSAERSCGYVIDSCGDKDLTA